MTSANDSPDGSAYEIALPEFEGPLDLLLHLVKRHELSILEIPIAFITEKYIEYLDLMTALNIDIAGEYLLMAATLAHIKSRELLPRPEIEPEDEDEDEGDPRQELIRRLLEYQRYKEAAAQLGDQPKLGRRVFSRGIEMERPDPKDQPLAETPVFALIDALAEVLKRSKVRLTYDVVIDRISITDRINEIVDRLATNDTVRFIDCFDISDSGETARHELVVTFLAILELARLKMIRVHQQTGDADDHGEIYLTRTTELRSVDDAEGSFAG